MRGRGSKTTGPNVTQEKEEMRWQKEILPKSSKHVEFQLTRK